MNRKATWVAVASILSLGMGNGLSHAKVDTGGKWVGGEGLIQGVIEHDGATGRAGSGGSQTPKPPPVQSKTTPACNGGGGYVAGNICAIGNICSEGQILLDFWTRTGDGPWMKTRTECGPSRTGALPVVTVTDLQRVGLPASPLNIQPNTGEALINVPLILATADETVTRDTTVLGFPVTIRATPTSWTWDLGDGATVGPTSDPGQAYPHQSLTHTYTAPGDHQITLTTTWSGEYTIAGLPYRPIDGTATTASAPVPVHVLHGHNVLVPD